MTTEDALSALRSELQSSLSDERWSILEHPLSELEGLLGSSEPPDFNDAWLALDHLEDVLEALMRDAGWPAPSRRAR